MVSIRHKISKLRYDTTKAKFRLNYLGPNPRRNKTLTLFGKLTGILLSSMAKLEVSVQPFKPQERNRSRFVNFRFKYGNILDMTMFLDITGRI